MLKYVDTMVTFSEVPSEISLCINISGCPNRCSGCHSKYLWKDYGEVLNKESLFSLIDKNQGITCVCLMGGDQAPNSITWLAKCIKEYYANLKVAWYSGRQELAQEIDVDYFDYIKLGPFIADKGGLNNPDTNQRFYSYSKYFSDHSLIGKGWRDTTYMFWKNASNY